VYIEHAFQCLIGRVKILVRVGSLLN